jgi:hypothetical protein
MRVVFAIVAIGFVSPLVGSMVMAMQSFQATYSETLCRIESVRVNAIDDIERDRPIAADFGGDECLTPTLPTFEIPAIELGLEATAEAPMPTATPDPGSDSQ